MRQRPREPPPLTACVNDALVCRSTKSMTVSERCSAAKRWLSEKRTFSTLPLESTTIGGSVGTVEKAANWRCLIRMRRRAHSSKRTWESSSSKWSTGRSTTCAAFTEAPLILRTPFHRNKSFLTFTAATSVNSSPPSPRRPYMYLQAPTVQRRSKAQLIWVLGNIKSLICPSDLPSIGSKKQLTCHTRQLR